MKKGLENRKNEVKLRPPLCRPQKHSMKSAFPKCFVFWEKCREYKDNLGWILTGGGDLQGVLSAFVLLSLFIYWVSPHGSKTEVRGSTSTPPLESVQCRFCKCCFGADLEKIGKVFEMGAASKTNSRKPWASILTLSPCGNRCRFSEVSG